MTEEQDYALTAEQRKKSNDLNNLATPDNENLNGLYKKMYAGYSRQTQNQNNKILANANKQASRQASKPR